MPARSEQGQSLILFALVFIAMTGIVAMVLDVGLVFENRRTSQNATDAAALAAVQDLSDGVSNNVAEDTAREYVSANGFTGDLEGVEVSIPPVSGTRTGDTGCAEVEATTESPSFFSQVFGFDFFETGARAVACMEIGASGNYAIIALNEHACQAMAFNGTINITVNGGGIWDNSDCEDDAFWANGNVNINSTRNDVRGGCDIVGNPTITPPCTHPSDPIADPLAGVPEPTPPSGPVRTCPGNGNRTLQPGVYNCQIRPGGNSHYTFQPGDYLITGGILLNGNVSATFGAGVYTLRGNGLTVNGGADVTSSNAMFFIDEGSVDLSGTSDLDFTPPGTGPYEGIVIFQARDNTNGLSIHGTAASGNSGTIYAPGATVTYQGTSSTSFQFIVDIFTTGGTTDTVINFTDGFAIPSEPTMRLVE